jgi:hypothetical protein
MTLVGSARVAHWLEAVQLPQVFVAEQMGAAAGQVALVWHCATTVSIPPASVPVDVSSGEKAESLPASMKRSQPAIPVPSQTQR